MDIHQIEQQINYVTNQLRCIPNPPRTQYDQNMLMKYQNDLANLQDMYRRAQMYPQTNINMGYNNMPQPTGYGGYNQHFQPYQQRVNSITSTPNVDRYSNMDVPTRTQPSATTPTPNSSTTITIKEDIKEEIKKEKSVSKPMPGHEHELLLSIGRKEVKTDHGNGWYSREVEASEPDDYQLILLDTIKNQHITDAYDIYKIANDKLLDGNTFVCKYDRVCYLKYDINKFADIVAQLDFSKELKDDITIINFFNTLKRDIPDLVNIIGKTLANRFNIIRENLLPEYNLVISNFIEDYVELNEVIQDTKLVKRKEILTNIIRDILKLAKQIKIKVNNKSETKNVGILEITIIENALVITDSDVNDFIENNFDAVDDIRLIRDDSSPELYNVLTKVITKSACYLPVRLFTLNNTCVSKNYLVLRTTNDNFIIKQHYID